MRWKIINTIFFCLFFVKNTKILFPIGPIDVFFWEKGLIIKILAFLKESRVLKTLQHILFLENTR